MLPSSLAAASSQAFKAAGSATSTALPKPWGLSPPMISRRCRRHRHYGRRSLLSCDRKANALATARHERALSLQAESPSFPT